jgi:hypothetical protein
MTKEVGPGEPTSWDSLPPLGASERRGASKKAPGKGGLPKAAARNRNPNATSWKFGEANAKYQTVTVSRKVRKKRVDEERAAKDSQDRSQNAPLKAAKGSPQAPSKKKRRRPRHAAPKGSQIDQVFAKVRSNQAKAKSPMSRTTLPD